MGDKDPIHFTNSPNMRKIESQMCAAVQSNIDWKSGNTEVTIDKETNTSSVYLHGNLIATVTDNDMTIYDGGWQTTTLINTVQNWETDSQRKTQKCQRSNEC